MTDREKTAGFIGCGKMGGALAAAASRSGWTVYATDHHPENTQRLQKECGAVVSSTEEIAKTCRFIFLGVKPQGMEQTLSELAPFLAEREPGQAYVIVTMAAGISMAAVSHVLDNCPVIRIMPNTPAAVGEGVLLYCTSNSSAAMAQKMECTCAVTEEEEAAFLELLNPAGMLIKIDESKIDAASAVSGCGPAFVCLFTEALIQGAVRCGLSGELAKRLALQTVYGTAKLALQTNRDPALLRGDVCSPAGSTMEGVAVLEERAVRSAVLEAVTAAYRRTMELGNANTQK